jgi:AcrR family transcriptional regulator
VKKIAASDFLVEYHDVEKRYRRLVGHVRQLAEAFFACFGIEPGIRYALIHQLQDAHLIEECRFKISIHQLAAAQRLCRTRGETGLTLRAVASEAGTSTPTVYKRFRNKEALRKALAERFRSQLNEYLFASKSIEVVCRNYLAYVEEHRHEYQLLLHSWSDIFHPNLPRPGRAWLMTQFASRFGGAREDYSLCVYALFLLSHGAATLLSIPSDDIARDEVHRSFLEISDALIQQNQILRA